MAPLPCSPELLQRASDLCECGSHAQALRLLDAAIAAGRGGAALQCARGWALENLRPPRLAEARAAYDAALALDAGHLWSWLGLATVLGPLGLHDRCPAIYRDLIERAQARAVDEPELLELLGWCQYRLGRLADAAASFRHALAVGAGGVAVQFDLGLVLLLSGPPGAAREPYRDALQALAGRDPAARAGPIGVALDDLDEAAREHPAIAAEAAPLREQLESALRAAGVTHA